MKGGFLHMGKRKANIKIHRKSKEKKNMRKKLKKRIRKTLALCLTITACQFANPLYNAPATDQPTILRQKTYANQRGEGASNLKVRLIITYSPE